jgi:hypothetical protein
VVPRPHPHAGRRSSTRPGGAADPTPGAHRAPSRSVGVGMRREPARSRARTPFDAARVRDDPVHPRPVLPTHRRTTRPATANRVTAPARRRHRRHRADTARGPGRPLPHPDPVRRLTAGVERSGLRALRRAAAAGWPLSPWASACRHRAVRFDRYVHPSLLARLADDARLVGSGVSARSLAVDVLALDQVEGYVSADAWPGLLADYGVLEAARSSFRFRVPPVGLFVFGDSGEAPWPVMANDHFETGKDRSCGAARELVERLA